LTKTSKVTTVTPFNLDGREFIRQSLKELNKNPDLNLSAGTIAVFDHYVMNLPATAIEFLGTYTIYLNLNILTSHLTPRLLDAFIGLYAGYKDTLKDTELPMIHVHCFTRSEQPEQDIRERVEAVLKCPIEPSLIHNVRRVAPNKEMYCISFKLPREAAFRE
jgi:tRNA (guanine37-N1)-methyltransferase